MYDRAQAALPTSGDVVQVLAADLAVDYNQRLGAVSPGARVCFAGKVYDVGQGREARTLTLVDTGIVSARVTQTFQHTGAHAADTIIDATIRADDGADTVLHATPNHPFYLPDEQAYAALGTLSPGARLLTADGRVATLVAMTTRTGQFDVYNLEVEGPHNYYVGDLRVLVHNKAATFRGGGRTVLGRYPKYAKFAKRIGANFFEIPMDIWNKMSEAEQLAANTKFLDRAIARGDEIYLSTRFNMARPNTAFYGELEYLKLKGYKPDASGKRMIRP